MALSIEQQLRQEWADKPYFSLSTYLKKTYGEKIFKVSLDGGFTCPNRDGKIGTGGCIFCSAGGSGEFASKVCSSITVTDYDVVKKDIDLQIQSALSRFGSKNVGKKYIAYFQAYTGTYASPKRLYALYSAALSHPDIIGISIATRPDCLDQPILDVLKKCKQEFSDKFIWVELGLQSIHEKTANYIRRGYALSCFDDAIKKLHELDIPIIVHVILGLPNETDSEILETIQYLNHCNIFGIKLQLLHVLRGTDLASDYQNHKFECMSKEHYIELLISCIDHLNPNIVIHRVTGDGPKDLLIAPEWSLYKWDTLNTLHRKMKEEKHYQGKLFSKSDL